MKRDPNLDWQHVEAKTLKLKGYQAIVIGGTGGIGRAISHLLAARGATVTVIGQTFRDQGMPGIAFIKADLSSMQDARRVAAELPVETLDLLLMTTGVMAGPERETTSEGIENDMAISYLNRLVMLRQFGPRLGKARPANAAKPRVFIMGFPGAGGAGKLGDLNADRSYDGWSVHANTVAGNEILVLDAVDKYPNANFYGLNPGLVETNIRAKALQKLSPMTVLLSLAARLMAIKPEMLAERITPLLVSPDLENHSGAMFNNKAEAILPSQKLVDAPYRARFLAESDALLARQAGITLP
ncbi:SDR family NAD(P)-dependent oxidoreductase [uncultured Devosia sp.]|uniref:SDR family NAD(P)-dependent oxidoreductase n=1 Tax=uncultured Devosia sp. TaxID=211434 RepID=UPI0035C97C54